MLAHQIVQEDYQPVPTVYSQGLLNLIATLLQKDDKLRPTTSEIFAMPLIKAHMSDFINQHASVTTNQRESPTKKPRVKTTPEEKKELAAIKEKARTPSERGKHNEAPRLQGALRPARLSERHVEYDLVLLIETETGSTQTLLQIISVPPCTHNVLLCLITRGLCGLRER